MNEVGRAIRAARSARCLTLRELGALVGMSVSYLSDIELGRRRLPSHRVSDLELALGILLPRSCGCDVRIRELEDKVDELERETARLQMWPPRF